MSAALLIALVLGGALAQTLLPNIGWAGDSPVPLLTALALVYALRASPGFALAAALLAGVCQDSLSLMPLGYSSFGFGLCALVVQRYRDLMVVDSWFTHVVLGAVCGFAVNLLTGVFLVAGGMAEVSAWHLAIRTAGAAVLTALVTPLVFAVVRHVEGRLGLAPELEVLP